MTDSKYQFKPLNENQKASVIDKLQEDIENMKAKYKIKATQANPLVERLENSQAKKNNYSALTSSNSNLEQKFQKIINHDLPENNPDNPYKYDYADQEPEQAKGKKLVKQDTDEDLDIEKDNLSDFDMNEYVKEEEDYTKKLSNNSNKPTGQVGAERDLNNNDEVPVQDERGDYRDYPMKNKQSFDPKYYTNNYNNNNSNNQENDINNMDMNDMDNINNNNDYNRYNNENNYEMGDGPEGAEGDDMEYGQYEEQNVKNNEYQEPEEYNQYNNQHNNQYNNQYQDNQQLNNNEDNYNNYNNNPNNGENEEEMEMAEYNNSDNNRKGNYPQQGVNYQDYGNPNNRNQEGNIYQENNNEYPNNMDDEGDVDNMQNEYLNANNAGYNQEYNNQGPQDNNNPTNQHNENLKNKNNNPNKGDYSIFDKAKNDLLRVRQEIEEMDQYDYKNYSKNTLNDSKRETKNKLTESNRKEKEEIPPEEGAYNNYNNYNNPNNNNPNAVASE